MGNREQILESQLKVLDAWINLCALEGLNWFSIENTSDILGEKDLKIINLDVHIRANKHVKQEAHSIKFVEW